MNTEKTLADIAPEDFALVMAFSEKAYERLGSPGFVRVLPPPPEDKTPGNLIYAFGVEMLRLGMELTLEMFTSDKENTGI